MYLEIFSRRNVLHPLGALRRRIAKSSASLPWVTGDNAAVGAGEGRAIIKRGGSP
jgi:hypothetical protein